MSLLRILTCQASCEITRPHVCEDALHLESTKLSSRPTRLRSLHLRAWAPSSGMRGGPAARPVRHCGRRPRGLQDPDPKMAAPSEVATIAPGEGDGGGSGFGSWLDGRLEALGVDRAVYGAYILGILQEEEEEEKLDALQGILSAFLEEDSLLNICKEIVERWSETQNVVTKVKKEDEVQAIATLIEKQAQIVVKPRMVSEEEKQRKAALLAQYADVTDEEDEADEKDDSGATTMNIGSDKLLFRNTNVEDVLNARKLERDSLRDESQRKKEQDKLQRERDKLAKQERKEKEKKRTQRGERKR
ncbi:coiled-coil domain-containing protein 43 isoform X1 [Pan troglodytes]|nr:coiled-coil domain-containing protein 43 isoform X1 [Pan troglodytes]XP_003805930.4 coiled-coil domain-containing protein 43 [Pan paniscus]